MLVRAIEDIGCSNVELCGFWGGHGWKMGLLVVEVGDRVVVAQGRWVWVSWWVRSRSRVCSGADVRVMLLLEVSSSGSECPTPDAGSRGCSWTCATSTGDCSVDMKWWRTLTAIASEINFDLPWIYQGHLPCLWISLSHHPILETLKPPVSVLMLKILRKTLRTNLWFNWVYVCPHPGQA